MSGNVAEKGVGMNVMPGHNQRTLANEFRFEGTGIHTGARAAVAVWPADVNTGRVIRTGNSTFAATSDMVLDTRRCTTLGTPEGTVQTVEHLLSALFAFGIDNCLIEVDGPEIPILDGSSLPHIHAIEQSGIIDQNERANVLLLSEEIVVEERGSILKASPNNVSLFDVVVGVEFGNWPDGNRTHQLALGTDWALNQRVYSTQVAPARTFAFRQEVEQLISAGLARGGSLDNALIITPPDEFSSALRLPGEWCAHKLLDVVGDLSLVGMRLGLRLDALRPGHTSNVHMAQLLREWWKRQNSF